MKEFDYILRWVPHGARVLDLGCGDGALLTLLRERKHVSGYGLEIDAACIATCLTKGVNVIEQNFDEGLTNFASQSFDLTLLTSTLQAARRPDQLLMEMLRIGKNAIVTFPNFGHWRHRLFLAWRGRMPAFSAPSYPWYETPNIHLCTIKDFETLCQTNKIHIQNKVIAHDGLVPSFWPNLFGTAGMFLLGRPR